MASLDERTSYIFGVWNRIALLTGEVARETWQAVEIESERFRRPTLRELLWAMPSYWSDVGDVLQGILGHFLDGLEVWRDGVSLILLDVVSKALPFPSELDSRVMRGGDALRVVIRELVRIAATSTQADREAIERTVLEVADVSIDSPPGNEPTLKQSIWRRVVQAFVLAGTLFIPFAVAYTAGIFYLRVWAGDVELPTLSQDSRRIRVNPGKIRTRENRRAGPDRP